VAESYAINSTARELERRGHDVTVTLLEPPDGRRTELPYRVHDVPGDRTDPASKLVRTYEWMMANQFDYDLYHIYGPRYAPAGGLYRARGVKLLSSPPSTDTFSALITAE